MQRRLGAKETREYLAPGHLDPLPPLPPPPPQSRSTRSSNNTGSWEAHRYVIAMATHLGPPPPIPNSTLITRETAPKALLTWGHSTKCLITTSQNCSGGKDKVPQRSSQAGVLVDDGAPTDCMAQGNKESPPSSSPTPRGPGQVGDPAPCSSGARTSMYWTPDWHSQWTWNCRGMLLKIGLPL